MRDGWFDIPTGPGLGVEVDEAFVRACATVHEVATQGTVRGSRRSLRRARDV